MYTCSSVENGFVEHYIVEFIKQSINVLLRWFLFAAEMKSSANADPFHPFNFPKEGPRARAFTPDVMERFESAAFPEYTR